MVRDAAVKPIDTKAKIRNWTARLSIPTRPASAAASAPTPNHSSTKPDVKISATISIAPRMLHNTHNQLGISVSVPGSAFEDVLHHEPNVRRTFCEPPHEVRIPVFPVRHIDSYVEAITRKLAL